MTQAHGSLLSPDDEIGTQLLRWVSACWLRTWRETYGEEMALPWEDAGANSKEWGARATS